MFSLQTLLVFAFLAASALGAPSQRRSCTGTISSLDDVSSAQECTTINIESFTVPAGETFTLDLESGTTVNLLGDITFGNETWAGPLFEISGSDITFNGNGYTFNGNGPYYWDGQGSNGGVTKPRPMFKIKMSGIWQDVKVLNSPCQVYDLINDGPLTLTGLTIDDSLGNYPNANSDGLPAGHNTDGFDVSTNSPSDTLTIENSVIYNQDDCLAINKGSNINFIGNTCNGGHGISIGSISSNVVVSNVYIANNNIVNNQQALRIKTDASATNSSVTNVTYVGNTASLIGSYGVIIDQSYPDTLGTPGTGVIISDINFITSETTLNVNSSAYKVAVNCGEGSCEGTWDWSKLIVNGGDQGPVNNFSGIEDYEQ